MIRDAARKLRVRSLYSQSKQTDPATGDLIDCDATHAVRVKADEIILQDSGGAWAQARMVDVTIDINASGVNGLDTGTKSPDTWYHVWIISDGGSNVKGLFSASASNPALPAGFPSQAYVGAVYNTNGNYLRLYYQNDRLAWAEKTCPLATTTFSVNPASVDVSASVPPTATSVILELSGLTTINGHRISNVYVGPTQTGPFYNQYMLAEGTVDHVQLKTQCEILLDPGQDGKQHIYAKVQTANDRLEINVLGWRY